MDKDIVCFAVPIAGALGCALAVWRLRPGTKIVFTGLGTGVVVALLNMAVEFAGAGLDIYHVSGPWMILRTPLPLTTGWVFMTLLFCLGYEIAVKRRKMMSVTPYILIGVVAGCLTDFFFYLGPGILTLGPNGSAMMIAAVWGFFVPLTVVLHELFKELSA